MSFSELQKRSERVTRSVNTRIKMATDLIRNAENIARTSGIGILEDAKRSGMSDKQIEELASGFSYFLSGSDMARLKVRRNAQS